MSLRGLAIFIVVLAACRGERVRPQSGDRHEVSPPQPPSCVSDPVDWRLARGERVVALGDVHGDLSALKSILRRAGVTDREAHWIGGTMVLVQTGDVLDRGDDELEILELLGRLDKEAKSAGGTVMLLNGNHELMNVQGDFRYVTDGGWADFRDRGPDRVGKPTAGSEREGAEPEREGRRAAFAPGGTWAKKLANQPVIAVVGDTVFAHGGVLVEHLDIGPAELNRRVQCWLEGTGEAPSAVVSNSNSPVWTRAYGSGEGACQELSVVLERLGVSRMVVGHTPQEGGISSACSERLWRIDVGMSAAYGGLPAALEIVGDRVRVLAE